METKSHVLEAILDNYEIRNGERITYEKVKEIINNTNLELKDLKKCFGIQWKSYAKMRKDINCCFHVKLYTEEEYREIIRKIKKQFNKKETITYKEIQNLQKEYKLGEKNIREIFEIPEKIKIEEITNLNISQNKYYKKEELTKQDKQKIKKEIMKYTKKKDEDSIVYYYIKVEETIDLPSMTFLLYESTRKEIEISVKGFIGQTIEAKKKNPKDKVIGLMNYIEDEEDIISMWTYL